MEYKYLLEKNKEYLEFEKSLNEVLNAKRDDLIKMNNEALSKMNLDALDYIQLKEILDTLGYNVDDKLKKSIYGKYLFKKPYTHSVLNKMDFLSHKERVALDTTLSRFKGKYINNAFWLGITTNSDTVGKIIDILVNEGYFSERKNIYCPRCYTYMYILKENKMKLLKELDEIKARIEEIEDEDSCIEELDALYERHDELTEGECDDLLYLYCPDCDNEIEFDGLASVLNHSKTIYFCNKNI